MNFIKTSGQNPSKNESLSPNRVHKKNTSALDPETVFYTGDKTIDKRQRTRLYRQDNPQK